LLYLLKNIRNFARLGPCQTRHKIEQLSHNFVAQQSGTLLVKIVIVLNYVMKRWT